jgi:hypothetical protein
VLADHVGDRAGTAGAATSTYVFAAAEVERRWRAFVRQYKDLMQVVLLVAGVGRRYAVEGRGDQEGDPQVVEECAVP